MSHQPVVVERTYYVPVEHVWQALTDLEKMRQWYFNLDKFEPVVGFEFSFAGEGHKGEHYTHRCRITEVVLNKKLQYRWRYEGYEGNSLVTFELFNEGEQTRVKLTHSGLETFSQQNADFERSSFEEGWNVILGTMLKNFVEGNS